MSFKIEDEWTDPTGSPPDITHVQPTRRREAPRGGGMTELAPEIYADYRAVDTAGKKWAPGDLWSGMLTGALCDIYGARWREIRVGIVSAGLAADAMLRAFGNILGRREQRRCRNDNPPVTIERVAHLLRMTTYFDLCREIINEAVNDPEWEEAVCLARNVHSNYVPMTLKGGRTRPART